ncbi:acetyltransferase [Acetobacterium carbinolicum]|jgi:sugar O-acyltransferase (sialic acid O-acetyltransferase NeuD family)|uniref:acetyltransferase n=1 Tax=Acetobacterium TaxID=33951 RepID=UPI000DBEBDB1|nr:MULTISPECIES: acetyltransferase [unclassified Acetobacterium]AWW25419.1 acetyltransferase [Acetobacterium sp. KB-1]MDZ5723933.1 acetyltransferase [Acetobacterium sp. K1/6]
MKEKLMIIGASGHGKVVVDIAIKMNIWKHIFFLDDDVSITTCMGYRVVGKTVDAVNYIDEADIFVAVGNNAIRENIHKTLGSAGAKLPVLIHPAAIIGSEVEIGVGSVIMAGVVINSATRIGRGCIINTAATVDHDNRIADYVHVSPGAHLAGMVEIGEKSWIGIGSVVSNNLTVTANCKIGAGAVVVKDITESGTYVGVPARSIR